MSCVGTRNYAIDALRVFAMFGVVILHTINYGTDYLKANQTSNIDIILSNILYQTALNSVNCFVLITGYFSISSKITNTNWKKVVKLWMQVFFYSAGIYFLLIYLGKIDFSMKSTIKCLMPIFFDQYWFMTQYIIMLVISPFLAKLAFSLSKKNYLSMLMSLFIITSIVPMQGVKTGYSLLWFIFLFFVAGYLKLYNNWNLKDKIKTFTMSSRLSKIINCDSLQYVCGGGKKYIISLFFAISILCALSIFVMPAKVGTVFYLGSYNGVPTIAYSSRLRIG